MLDPRVLERLIDLDTVHQVPLQVEVIDEERTVFICIVLGLSQREVVRVERDEAIDAWPLFNRTIQDHILREFDDLEVVEAAQPVEDLLHGLRVDLLLHGA